MVGDGGDEGHEVATAEELGEEQRGVALGFRRIDPVQGCPQDTCVTAAFPKDSATIAAHLDRPLIFPIDDDDVKLEGVREMAFALCLLWSEGRQ